MPSSRHLRCPACRSKATCIHHRNGIRDDNRPENLELWTKPQPSGIRMSDAIAWARELLERYGSVECGAPPKMLEGSSTFGANESAFEPRVGREVAGSRPVCPLWVMMRSRSVPWGGAWATS